MNDINDLLERIPMVDFEVYKMGKHRKHPLNSFIQGGIFITSSFQNQQIFRLNFHNNFHQD